MDHRNIMMWTFNSVYNLYEVRLALLEIAAVEQAKDYQRANLLFWLYNICKHYQIGNKPNVSG